MGGYFSYESVDVDIDPVVKHQKYLVTEEIKNKGKNTSKNTRVVPEEENTLLPLDKLKKKKKRKRNH